MRFMKHTLFVSFLAAACLFGSVTPARAADKKKVTIGLEDGVGLALCDQADGDLLFAGGARRCDGPEKASSGEK